MVCMKCGKELNGDEIIIEEISSPKFEKNGSFREYDRFAVCLCEDCKKKSQEFDDRKVEKIFFVFEGE